MVLDKEELLLLSPQNYLPRTLVCPDCHPPPLSRVTWNRWTEVSYYRIWCAQSWTKRIDLHKSLWCGWIEEEMCNHSTNEEDTKRLPGAVSWDVLMCSVIAEMSWEERLVHNSYLILFHPFVEVLPRAFYLHHHHHSLPLSPFFALTLCTIINGIKTRSSSSVTAKSKWLHLNYRCINRNTCGMCDDFIFYRPNFTSRELEHGLCLNDSTESSVNAHA